MAHAFRSIPAKLRIAVIAALVASTATSVLAGQVSAGVDRFNGYLSVGYARLFVQDAPGGSFSIVGGLTYPMTESVSIGAGAGFHLLGSQTIKDAGLVSNLDYSMFEAVAFVHWSPDGIGPLRISAGPAIVSAHAELSGGGASFGKFAVEELAPGFGIDLTLMQRRPAPVRVGFELGTRVGFLANDTWTLGTARVVFHY